MNFDHKKETIREKYCFADFPPRLVDNVISQFHQKLSHKQTEEELIIPDFLFELSKRFVLVKFYFA